jgi:hypothetical protein
MSLKNINPYNDLLGLMRTQGKFHNPLVPMVGKITKITPRLEEIEIETHKMPLYKDDLVIDKWLKNKHHNLGYTCDIKNCKDGIIGKVEHTEDEECGSTHDVKCINFDSCPKKCEKLSNKGFKCEDCTIPCRTELHFDDRLKVDDLVLLVPYEEKFIIISKVVSI